MGIVAVQQPRRVDHLGNIAKGLQIAQSIYGFKTTSQQQELNKLKLKAQETSVQEAKLKRDIGAIGFQRGELLDKGLLSFESKDKLGKSLGFETFEDARKTFPMLEANIVRATILDPREVTQREIDEGTVEVAPTGADPGIILPPAIKVPTDIGDFIPRKEIIIPQQVLNAITKNLDLTQTSTAFTPKEFADKYIDTTRPINLRGLSDKDMQLLEDVPVIGLDPEGRQVILRKPAIRRSRISKPVSPIAELAKALTIQARRGQIELQGLTTEAKRGQIERQELDTEEKKRKVGGIFTEAEAGREFKEVGETGDDVELFRKQFPFSAPLDIKEVTIRDQATGEDRKSFVVDADRFDKALSASRTGKRALAKEEREKAPFRGPQNQFEFKSSGFADRMSFAEKTLSDLDKKGFDRGSKRTSAESLLPEVVKSQDLKSYERAARDFVTAQLRLESGAAISPKEFDTEEKKFFPQAGDGPKVQAEKKKARRIAFENMMKSSRRDPNPIPKGYIRMQKGDEILTLPIKAMKEAEEAGFKVIGRSK